MLKDKDKGLVDRARWATGAMSSVEAMEAEGVEGDGSPGAKSILAMVVCLGI